MAKNIYKLSKYVIVTIVLLTVFSSTMATQLTDRYGDKRPIKMACDMDFPPYEYRNDNGDAAGFNIDVAKAIAREINVPITFEMKEWNTVINDVKHGKVDLMLVASLENNVAGLYYSKLVVTPYKVAIAFRQGTKPITKITDIPSNAKVAFKAGDYCHGAAKKAGIKTKHIFFSEPKQALYGIEKGIYDYFVYCELPLKWGIRQYQLSDIQVRLVDVPGQTFRFVSKDKELLDAVDDNLARIMQKGELNSLRNKWLVYGGTPNGVEGKLLMALFVVMLIVVVLIVCNRIVSRKVKRMLRDTFEVNQVLSDALVASRNNVIIHKLQTGRIENVSGKWLPRNGMSKEDFRNHIHPDDRDKVTFVNAEGLSPKDVATTCQYRWNIGSDANPIWRSMVNQPVPEVNKSGKLVSIISTVTDITEVKQNQRKESELANRFSQIFDNSIVGFALYDANGKLIEGNTKYQELLNFQTYANRVFYEATNLFDIDSVKEAFKGRERTDYLAYCTKMSLYGNPTTQYVEVRVRHICDDNGMLTFFMVTITLNNEDRKNFLQSRNGDSKIREVSKKVQQYENELRYLLESAHMRVWSTSKLDNKARFFKDLRSYEARMSIETFISKVVRDEDKDLALRLADCTYNKCQPVMGMIKIKNLFNENEGERWYSINSIPSYDADGTLLGCFGLIRDITLMIDSQEKLMEETARANESDQQKSAFLANMSHEIRTPLNAIVGFCDLLQAVDEPEEKMEFMRIIRNNCDMLLMLIDDILTLSTIDSAESQLRFRNIDFASAFNDMSTSLAQRVATKPSLEFIVDNPYLHIDTVLDKDRLQQVVTNFVTNAVKNTEQGHVKLGLTLSDGGLRIYCEDTGCGIPQDKCEHIFKRFVKLNDFVQGAGLGLSICKKIAEMYRGKIGVDSKVGEGSTFWIWVPCEVSKFELCKKEE